MKSPLRLVLPLALGACVASGPAVADTTPYVALDAMAVLSSDPLARWDSDSDDRGSEPPSYANPSDFDWGWGVLLSLGYNPQALGPLSTELELGYREAGVDDLPDGHRVRDEGTSDLFYDGGDDLQSLSLMANVVYEVPVSFALRPYLGAGFGGVRHELGGEHDTVWGVQALAGVRYPLTEATSVRLGYRVLGTQDMEFSPGGDMSKVHVDYLNHSVALGLVHRFSMR